MSATEVLAVTPEQSWPVLISALLARQPLRSEDTGWAMEEIMAGRASDAQIAGFLVALRAKGATEAEMSGLVATMLAHAHRIDVAGPIVDVVGTGGDRSHTVNLSTMAALVVAGAGYRVVKHGNRAASSKCGSADVLEELGVVLTLSPEDVAELVDEVGITFCFAQVFHPAMRHAAAARRELGVATAFNFLGPLTNPAQPQAQAVGCADELMAPVLADVYARRGVAALVVRGDDGLDEVTVSTTTTAWDVRHGAVSVESIDPRQFGFGYAPASALRGGDCAHNAAVALKVMSGEMNGPIRDAVVLNAAAAIAAADETAASLNSRLAEGVAKATDSLDSGAAAIVLQRWIAGSKARSG